MQKFGPLLQIRGSFFADFETMELSPFDLLPGKKPYAIFNATKNKRPGRTGFTLWRCCAVILNRRGYQWENTMSWQRRL